MMTELAPHHEGSDEACALLLVLNRHHFGSTVADLAILARMPQETARRALQGLQDRHRVRCFGRGAAALWTLPQHADKVVL